MSMQVTFKNKIKMLEISNVNAFQKIKEIKKSIRNRQGERRFPKKNNSFIFLSNRAKIQKVREIILFFPKPQNKYIILKDDMSLQLGCLALIVV